MSRNAVPEQSIVKQILDYLNIKGYVCKRNNAGMMFMKGKKGKGRAIKIGEAGWPDIEGMTRQGRYFGIEVKSKTGIVTMNQKIVGQRINESNGLWFVAKSLHDVIQMGL